MSAAVITTNYDVFLSWCHDDTDALHERIKALLSGHLDDEHAALNAYMDSIFERLADAVEDEPPMPVAVAASMVMTDALLQRYPDDEVARLQRFWNLMGRMYKRLLGEK